MPDHVPSLAEIQDRFAIIDLYDRQLAAAEAFDLERYDTTFAADARIDLSDFGRPECGYPEYRAWLAGLQETMLEAQRITGGLRLTLDGDRATTRVPVACHVVMATRSETGEKGETGESDEKDETGEKDEKDERRLTHTGLFYNDVLERRPEGWRIVRRVEELAWSA